MNSAHVATDSQARAALGTRYLFESDAPAFRRDYNRASFAFGHLLHTLPLFELPSLQDLVRRRPQEPQFAYWSNGSVDVGDTWRKGAGVNHSLTDTMNHIAENDSLVMLKRIETDEVFGPALQDILQTVVDMTGAQMRDDVVIGRATLLIASPRRVTAYHIDADTNFLLQIHGDKTMHVFDQTDRSVVTDEELERYHTGDVNAAVYKETTEKQSNVYELRAGDGVHIPSTAPHWATNRDSVSIALSINYDLRSVERAARIYRVNRRLRQLGAHPERPGNSRWKDHVKTAMSSAIDAAVRIRRQVID